MEITKEQILKILEEYKESVTEDSSRLPEYAVLENNFEELADEVISLLAKQ